MQNNGKMKEETSFPETSKISVGISRCLLGEEVRYNGSHKLSRYCRDHLSRWFHFVDTCPEVQIGMGIPREPIRLVSTGGEIEVQPVSGATANYAPALANLADELKPQLDELCGFIFMQKSPSCGVFRVKVYNDKGGLAQEPGRGAFAAAVVENHPSLPVEEAGRLTDPELRENFIARVFIYSEWRKLVGEGATRKAVIDFHSRHKYLLMAHSQRHYRLLGKFLARAGSYSEGLLASRYIKVLMSGLSKVAGRGGHANALQHMQGYLKKELDSESKAEITQLIDAYRKGEVPLVAPLVLLKHHAKLANDYYRSQVYLEPHPAELGLRNEI